jgi:acetyl esterase/lipase
MPRLLAIAMLTVACWTSGVGTLAQDAPSDPLPPDERYRSHTDLVYQEHKSGALKLDLYLPPEIKTCVPLVIWVHGGGWRGGAKDLAGEHILPAIENGFALASISYRFSDVATFPAQIHDVKAAVRWLRAHAQEYQLDPQRFGAWGASAGGHLVALLGTSGDVAELEGEGNHLDQSSRVQAVCDWFGPANFPTFDEQQNDDRVADDVDSLLVHFLGGTPQDKADLARMASPVHHITEDDPPLLIMHGDEDNIVPYAQSVELRDAYEQADLEVELVTLQDTGHGGGQFNNPQTSKRIWDFFRKHLIVEKQ